MERISYENGISNRGNVRRIRKVMARAEAGESLVIGFLGGSITQGSLASAPELCYAYRVFEWWKRTFPKASFTYVNAGIGGTTSHFGTARAESDLLSHAPDFAIVEFSVNDESTEFFRETYEGLVRRIWKAPCAPAVMLVHNVCYDTGGNAQLQHAQIARRYQLPAVSMQSSIYPELVSGRLENRAITQDDLHPNDRGHELVASVITYALEQIQKAPDDAPEPEVPAPLTENAYEKALRLDNRNYTPQTNGFEADRRAQKDVTDCFKNGWIAQNAGASIRFEVTGSEIAVQYKRCVHKPAPVALAVVDGDAEHAVTLDANFDEDWGDKLELTPLLVHGKDGAHTLEVTLQSGDAGMPGAFELIAVVVSAKGKEQE